MVLELEGAGRQKLKEKLLTFQNTSLITYRNTFRKSEACLEARNQNLKTIK
jgi:hypothetical protein